MTLLRLRGGYSSTSSGHWVSLDGTCAEGQAVAAMGVPTSDCAIAQTLALTDGQPAPGGGRGCPTGALSARPTAARLATRGRRRRGRAEHPAGGRACRPKRLGLPGRRAERTPGRRSGTCAECRAASSSVARQCRPALRSRQLVRTCSRLNSGVGMQ